MKFEIKDVVKTYKGRKVVNGVSIDVSKGEIVGLLGPNGAGKTTSFYMAVGIIRPEKGKIYLDGKDITKYPMHVRARNGIGYLAQENSVFRKLTVKENIQLIWQLRGISAKEQKRRLPLLLEEFSLEKVASQPAYTLSGGERRRVEIARAIATEPHFILLDEPFTGVDPIAVAEIQEIVKRLKKRDIGILITDHSVRETLAITERAYIIREGQILVSGTSEEVANNPIAIKYYLGSGFHDNPFAR